MKLTNYIERNTRGFGNGIISFMVVHSIINLVIYTIMCNFGGLEMTRLGYVVTYLLVALFLNGLRQHIVYYKLFNHEKE